MHPTRLPLALALALLPACLIPGQAPALEQPADPSAFLAELERSGLLEGDSLELERVLFGDELEAPEPLDRAARAQAAAALPRLFTIDLPAGDVGSINVGWIGKNGAAMNFDPEEWLAQGYKGVKFRGQGVDVTHVRCTSWDGNTITVGRRRLIVRFEQLTLHAGSSRGLFFGEQNQGRARVPGFRVELADVRAVVDEPGEYFQREGKFHWTSGTGYRVSETVTATLEGVASSFRVTAATPIGVREQPVDQPDGQIRALELVQRGHYARPPPYQALPTSTNGSGTGTTITLGHRPTWLLFAYNADLLARRCTFNAREAVEHASYWHGFSEAGALVVDCDFEGSGAEGFKVRSDASETAWAGPNQWIILRDCTFRDWFQPWSWRGGAAIVLQGTGAHVLVERCTFWGGLPVGPLTGKDRCKAVMVSSEGGSYDQETGAVGTGFGNGWVVVRDCYAWGTSEVDWSNTIARVGRNGGTQRAARGFLLERSGLFGPKMIVQMGDVPSGMAVIRDCNGAAQIAYATGIGMPTSPEATFPTSSRRVPLSEGIRR